LNIWLWPEEVVVERESAVAAVQVVSELGQG
jgi:hypothetical protein